MTRYLFGFLCVCVLGVMPLVGCGDNNGGGSGGSAGSGGSGGSGGTGGMAGTGGVGGMGGTGGTAGTGGIGGAGGTGGAEAACHGTVCACTEAGIRAAIAEGGGPFTFDCAGPQTVVTEAEIVIDDNVILDGEGNLTVDGDEDHRVFSVPEAVAAELRGLSVRRGIASGDLNDGYGGGIYNEGTLTLTHSTVSANIADEVGGGIANFGGRLTLTNSTVSGNNAGYGGGIYNGYGTMTLTHSTVSGNTATTWGGGIYNDYGTMTLTHSTVSANIADEVGGGIANFGTMTLTESTVSANTATSAYSGGGGIYNGGTLTLTNSTVSENTASQNGGGGIYNAGTLTLTHSTVSGNTGDESAGAIFNYYAGTLTLTNSLVDDDCEGTIVSGGGNLESPSDTCGFDQGGDQASVTAEALKLGPLADNGGPTMTHALLPGSVAIDQIAGAECFDADGEPLTTDQRGVTRPQGPACDVGAFELEQ